MDPFAKKDSIQLIGVTSERAATIEANPYLPRWLRKSKSQAIASCG
jgi:hypothetical protein